MKKLHLSILYVVLLSLLIGGAILLSKPADKSRYNNETIVDEKSNTVIAGNIKKSVNENKKEISKNESIKVINNAADTDLHVNLVEDMSGQVSLNLSYKLSGKLVTKKIDTLKVSEIRNIFKFRELYGNGYRVNNVILNKKMNKVYFSVEGKQDKRNTHTTIYCYDLKNSKIDKLFYDLGTFSKFSVSPDGKYSVFSYISCPQNIYRNEKNIVVIIRCSDNKPMLNSNEDFFGKQDDKSNNLYVYSYHFIKWQKNSICELRQSIKAKDNSQKEQEQTIFYNIISKSGEMK